MKISLYPYNVWILYAALVILILCLVLTLVHALKMLKSLNTLAEGAARMQEKTGTMTAALQKPEGNSGKKKISFRQILAAWLFFSAVKKDYDRHELNGMKQAAASARNVYSDRVLRKIISQNKTGIF